MYRENNFNVVQCLGRTYTQKNHHDANAFRLIGRSYQQQKKLDSATFFLEKALLLDSVTDAGLTLFTLRLLATVHIESGDTSRGIKELYAVRHILPKGNKKEVQAIRAMLENLGCDPDSVFRHKPIWQIVEGKHIDYYFEDTSGISTLMPWFINRHEATFDTLNSFFQAKLKKKIKYYVWLDRDRAHRVLDKYLSFAQPTVYEVNTALLWPPAGHEMTHILAYYAWGIMPVSDHRFVKEGLAVAFDQYGSRDKIAQARKVFATQKYRGVLDVWLHEESTADSVLYPIAGAFMQYLFKYGKLEDFKRIVKSQSLIEAIDIYGKDNMQKLVSDFDAACQVGQ